MKESDVGVSVVAGDALRFLNIGPCLSCVTKLRPNGASLLKFVSVAGGATILQFVVVAYSGA